jgi:hypothetical protein
MEELGHMTIVVYRCGDCDFATEDFHDAAFHETMRKHNMDARIEERQ